jgi:hypothetical protein
MIKARILLALCAPLLAVGLAACGTTASTSVSGFKGEQHAVAQRVADLQSHATALEQKKICGEDLSSAIVARLNAAPGGCAQAIEAQLKEIDNFETTVEGVQIKGVAATARVKSVNAGKKSTAVLSLVKEKGGWRISGVS